ncbi:MAG: hypothetical protein RR194_06335, partial [Ruthenibacterium sp.]
MRRFLISIEKQGKTRGKKTKRGDAVVGGARQYQRAREFLLWLDVDDGCVASDAQHPPFADAVQLLKRVCAVADVAVCSDSGVVAAKLRWAQWKLPRPNGIFSTGTAGKAACLTRLIACGYQPAHVLAVGVTQASLAAAQQCGALYYPILTGRQAASWQRLTEEGLYKLLHGSFAGDYQRQLLAAQHSLL